MSKAWDDPAFVHIATIGDCQTCGSNLPGKWLERAYAAGAKARQEAIDAGREQYDAELAGFLSAELPELHAIHPEAVYKAVRKARAALEADGAEGES